MATVALLVFVVLFAAAVPVAAVLGILAITLTEMFSRLPLGRALGEIAWTTGNEFLLVAVPLYILMGEILLRSGMATRMYEAMSNWLSWLPGGLMHSNIGACAVFAATSGSSVATAATIGTIALPQWKRFGYNERLFLGSLAAGGTLGILIPPSINLILYGFLTDTSVPQLYLAAFIPGFTLAFLFMITIGIACRFRPEWGGTRTEAVDWGMRWRSLRHLLPPIAIFLLVIGTIYGGVATATESAALGVLAALGLAAWDRRLTLPVLRAAIEGTLRITGMTMLIVLGAFFLNVVLSTAGISRQLTNVIQELGLTPFGTMIAIIVLYLILGCFMDVLAMMITTLPVIAPIVVALGYDPVWFGVLLTVLCETGMITPPYGINLFVVQTVRRSGSLNDVIIGSSPFVITMIVMLAVLLAWPELALWLPKKFY